MIAAVSVYLLSVAGERFYGDGGSDSDVESGTSAYYWY